MFEAALASLRPRRRGSLVVSTGLHVALAGALVLPPTLRMPELGVEPPENLPVIDTRILESPKSDEPVKLPERHLPPKGTPNGGGNGTTTTPKKFVQAPPDGAIPDLRDVPVGEDTCPDCEVSLTPPNPPGDGDQQEPSGDPRGADRPIVMTRDVTEPVPMETPAPPYPEPLRIAQIEGTVVLEAVIDREGFVRDVRVVSGVNPLMDRAATETVLKWRYRPARIGARPVAVYLGVSVRFRIRR